MSRLLSALVLSFTLAACAPTPSLVSTDTAQIVNQNGGVYLQAPKPVVGGAVAIQGELEGGTPDADGWVRVRLPEREGEVYTSPVYLGAGFAEDAVGVVDLLGERSSSCVVLFGMPPCQVDSPK